MKTVAIVATAIGGPEVLERRGIDLAWPGADDEVLVRLKAASVNPADAFFRELSAYVTTEQPLVLGHDGAGIVEAVGPAVTGFAAGDRVCFCNGGIGATPGTYAEFAVVPAAQLARVPDAVDFATAAALPLVAITAWESLYERADVQAGEHVLIHGGAGGTGHMAVQLAALRGAHVAATVRTPDKATFVHGLGAERAILYRDSDFVTETRQWTHGRGLDVALDNAGPDVMRATYRAMAPYGRIVTLMGTPGDDDQETAYVANLTIHNVMMLTPMVENLRHRLAHQAGIVGEAIALVADGKLKVHIADRLALADVAEAHRRLARGGMTGKLVLEIG